MNKFLFKILSFVPFLVLTSCGYGLKEVYDGLPYNSTVFEENYYSVWDKTLNPDEKKYQVTETKAERELTDSDFVFTSVEDLNFKECEQSWNDYIYEEDVEIYDEDETRTMYGPDVKLSGIDNSFKYGITSKLFDGQLFCNGDYQHARMQIEPSNTKREGFGIRFSKEMAAGAPYFMLNFKCSVVTENNYSLSFGYSDVTLKIGFYIKNGNGLTYIPTSYRINEAPTNSGDMPSNRNNSYVCFGFKLSEKTGDGLLNLDRLVGISFEYELNSCTVSLPAGEEPLYAIMLYEMSFPHSSWN